LPIADYDLFRFFCLFSIEPERSEQRVKFAQSLLAIRH